MRQLTTLGLALILLFPRGYGQDFSDESMRSVEQAASAISTKARKAGSLRQKLAVAALACGVVLSACGTAVDRTQTQSADGCQLVDQAFGKTAEALERVDYARYHPTASYSDDASDKAAIEAQNKVREAREILARAETLDGKCEAGQKALFVKEVGATLDDVGQGADQMRHALGTVQPNWDSVSRANFYAQAAAAKIAAIKAQAQEGKNGGVPTTSFPAPGACLYIRSGMDKAKEARIELDKATESIAASIQRGESTVNGRVILNQAHFLNGEAYKIYELLYNDPRPGNCNQQTKLRVEGLNQALSKLRAQEQQLQYALKSEKYPKEAARYLSDAKRYSEEALTLLQVLEVELSVSNR